MYHNTAEMSRKSISETMREYESNLGITIAWKLVSILMKIVKIDQNVTEITVGFEFTETMNEYPATPAQKYF